MKISILQYFQRQNDQNDSVSLPEPRGPLSKNKPSVPIVAANTEVRLLTAEVKAGQSPAHR